MIGQVTNRVLQTLSWCENIVNLHRVTLRGKERAPTILKSKQHVRRSGLFPWWKFCQLSSGLWWRWLCRLSPQREPFFDRPYPRRTSCRRSTWYLKSKVKNCESTSKHLPLTIGNERTTPLSVRPSSSGLKARSSFCDWTPFENKTQGLFSE